MTQNKSQFTERLKRSWPAILIVSVWLWMFWPMMSGQTVCGFRDSAYLYYPLFEWIDAQWAAGEIPLWNPYCNYGMPVVGDGTSSVFYPGKLIFFCRFLEYPARYGIYLAIHIPIAAAGTYWFARTLRANPTGATLAALAFAFGGSVIFQVCNVIYLVSAAWLPFALGSVWNMVKTGKYRWAIAAGTCSALMILGGDPQMVYHVGLIAVATILAEAWRRRSRWNRTRNKISRPYGFICSSSKRLAMMVLVTIGLSAFQLIPTYFWSQRSERTNPTTPANFYQVLLEEDVRQQSGSLIGPPTGIVDHIYQFSQPPWTLCELFWPNFSGKPFPVHQRWTDALPGADRVWVPSLYMGCMVALIGLTGIRFWGRRRRNVWLTWLFLFFCIASFGWYGAYWLFVEITGGPPTPAIGWQPQPTLGPQAGGLYWLMQMLLPKYYAFRYPAKLFVIASLALSVLAGVNLRNIRIGHYTKLAIGFAIAATIEFYLLSRLIPILGSSNPILAMPENDPLFGPFDAPGSLFHSWISIFQPLIILTLGFIVFWLVTRFTGRNRTSKIKLAIVHLGIVLLTVIDVVFANRWLLAEVPSQEAFDDQTPIVEQIEQLKSKRVDAAPIQLFRDRTKIVPPSEWAFQSSPRRLAEAIEWQRATLYPKHHLGEDVVLIGSFSSVWPTYYESELSMLESYQTLPGADWQFDGVIRMSGLWIPPYETKPEFQPNKNKPVAWIDSDGSLNPEIPITIEHFSSNRMIVKVSALSAGQIALGRIAERGWLAKVKNLDTESSETTYLKPHADIETLILPVESPGEYEIEFWYSPRSFWIGAAVSGISWLTLLAWFSLFAKTRFMMPTHSSAETQNVQGLPTTE